MKKNVRQMTESQLKYWNGEREVCGHCRGLGKFIHPEFNIKDPYSYGNELPENKIGFTEEACSFCDGTGEYRG